MRLKAHSSWKMRMSPRLNMACWTNSPVQRRCATMRALHEHDGVWTVEGDPMEGALLAFAGKMDVDARKEQAAWTRTDAIPFDAKHRFMATLNHDHEHHAFVFVKGAPERILAMCQNQRGMNGKTEAAGYGLLDMRKPRPSPRWVSACWPLPCRPVKPEHTVLEHADVEGTLTLLGMVGMIDPPRAEAIAAVRGMPRRGHSRENDHRRPCQDRRRHRQADRPAKPRHRCSPGRDLDGMDDAALRQAVLDCDIFARTSPEHKLRLVMALQSHGMTVAMTGRRRERRARAQTRRCRHRDGQERQRGRQGSRGTGAGG